MGADHSFFVKFIATRAPTFYGYIISVLASVSENNYDGTYFKKLNFLTAMNSNTTSIKHHDSKGFQSPKIHSTYLDLSSIFESKLGLRSRILTDTSSNRTTVIHHYIV